MLELLPFVHFYTLNFLRNITLKLPKPAKVSTRNFVGRQISLSRNDVHNRKFALPNFGVIALGSFLHFELCLGYCYRQYENFWLDTSHNIHMPNLSNILWTNYFSVSKMGLGRYILNTCRIGNVRVEYVSYRLLTVSYQPQCRLLLKEL